MRPYVKAAEGARGRLKTGLPSVSDDFADLRDGVQIVDDAVELFQIGGFDDKSEFDEAFGSVLRTRGSVHGFDVCAGAGNGLRHQCKQAVSICRLDEQDGAVGLVADVVPTGIELLFGVGFEQGGADVAVDNHAAVFGQYGADRVARDGVAAFGQMHAAGFLSVDFNRTELDFAAEVLARQFGDVHGDRNGQGVAHADVVEHFFKRGLLVVEIGKVFFFEVV